MFSAADPIDYTDSVYTSYFAVNVKDAWKGGNTFYFWKCYYICDPGNKTAPVEQRSGASFTVVSLPHTAPGLCCMHSSHAM